MVPGVPPLLKGQRAPAHQLPLAALPNPAGSHWLSAREGGGWGVSGTRPALGAAGVLPAGSEFCRLLDR